MQGSVPEPVVVCLGGMVSRNCSVSVDYVLEDYSKLVDVVDSVWEEEPGRPVLFVAASLRGFSGFLRELGELGRNPFMVEVTGIPESMLSGLSVDRLVEYYAGFMAVTLGERRRAVKRRPAVTRRELLRRLFLVTPEYVITPRLPEGRDCSEACPLGAIRSGKVDAGRCRGCGVCVHGCGVAPAWPGAAVLAYAYRYVSEHGLDGVVFVCRDRLNELEERVIEASPAKLLPLHVPCVGWLAPRLAAALRELGLYVHVLAGPGLCGGCPRWEPLASSRHLRSLMESGVVVSERLVEASMHAFTGYTRPRLELERVLEVLGKALSGD